MLCLYSSFEKIDSGQDIGLSRYYFKPILGYKCEGDMWLNQSNRINQEDAKEYEFKEYFKILKLLAELEQKASKRSWREKIDDPIATTELPA